MQQNLWLSLCPVLVCGWSGMTPPLQGLLREPHQKARNEGSREPCEPYSAWQHQFVQHHSCCLQELMVLLALLTLCKAVSQADMGNGLLPRDRGEKRLWVVDGGYRGMVESSL